MSGSFLLIQPAENLQGYIEAYLSGELKEKQETDTFEQKPISTGCIELIIGYQDTECTCYTNNGLAVRSPLSLVGPHNLKNTIKSVIMEDDPKPFRFVSVKFKPNGFYAIFKVPSYELYNNFFDPIQVIGKDIYQLRDQLNQTTSVAESKTSLDHFFIRQLNKNSHKSYNIRVGFDIAAAIRLSKGNIRITQLLDEFKITDRTLQRDVRTAIGLTPKEYCKITRFSNLIDHVSTNRNTDWLDMVNHFGYYDQAHLINEFKSVTGITPELYIQQKSKNIFKISNHLVFTKTNTLNNDIRQIMSKGEAYYEQFEALET